jgi:DNA-binding NarL/FixJ family response regulator
MIRLLIVDDHVLFLEALSSLIRGQADFTVVGEARSVAEAILLARQHKPDVVLMDFFLPDGTGLDATAQIMAELPNTKIVFLTAHEEDGRLFEAIRYGAQGYLLKTTPTQALLAALRGLERGEAAINRTATTRLMQEFSQLSHRQEPPAEIYSTLTKRERQILEHLLEGLSNRQIAARLVISEQTVKNHVSHILAKLNIKSRYEVIRWAGRRDL